VVPAEEGDQREQREEPERQADREDAEGAPQRGLDLVHQGICHRHDLGAVRAFGSVRLRGRELLRDQAPSEPAGEPRGGDDHGKGHAQEEDRDERGAGHGLEDAGLEGPPADPEDGLDDHGHHRRLQPEEQAGDERRIPIGGVEDGEGQDGEEAREHEENAGRETSEGPVEQPSDVGRELLCLGTGQQHAIVEGMEETALAHPPLLLDQDAVHDRDLAGRPSEALEGDQRPDPQSLPHGDRGGGRLTNPLHETSVQRTLKASVSPVTIGL